MFFITQGMHDHSLPEILKYLLAKLQDSASYEARKQAFEREQRAEVQPRSFDWGTDSGASNPQILNFLGSGSLYFETLEEKNPKKIGNSFKKICKNRDFRGNVPPEF